MGCQMDSKQYTYRVIWSAEDNEYVGLCAEFPSLSWLDADQSKAFSGIEDEPYRVCRRLFYLS